MADISNFWLLRHLRADTTSHVVLSKDARVVRSGRGISFWFSPMSASVAEVPVTDREVNVVVHGRSSDFQDVTAQSVVTYRVVDPETLASRVDFTVDLRTGQHTKQPLEKISLLLSELCHQHAWQYIATTPVRAILSEGHAEIRERAQKGLLGDEGLREMGLEIASVRVSSVAPTPELERALEAPERERIQQVSDEAAFARRALAVEKERAIQENALKNQIELARREENLIAQRGQNTRRQATEKAEAERIEAESQAAQKRLRGEAEAASVKLVEGARVEVERDRMQVFSGTPTEVLVAMAAQKLAEKLQRIDHLSLSPDGIAPLLQSLMSAGTRRLEAPANNEGEK